MVVYQMCFICICICVYTCICIYVYILRSAFYLLCFIQCLYVVYMYFVYGCLYMAFAYVCVYIYIYQSGPLKKNTFTRDFPRFKKTRVLAFLLSNSIG